MRKHSLCGGAAVVGTLLAAAPAHAVLVAASGAGTGNAQIAHQLAAKGAATGAGAAPVFQAPADFAPTATIGGAGGGLQSPGNGYRVFGGLIGQNQQAYGLVANVPITQTTAAGALGAGWNGATSTVVGVAGNGRAGIAVTNSTVSNVGAATESVNTVGASADYINVGAALVNVKYGQFISHTATVDGVGGFAAAAVRSRIQIDPNGLVGAAFGTAGGVITVQPSDLVMGFDGVGFGNPDFLNGADAGKSIFQAVGNGVTFAGVSTTGLFNIPLNASVRLSGALTLIGDPASLQALDLPGSLTTSDITLGYGDSSNAGTLLPEPTAALSLLLCGALLPRRRGGKAA